MLGSGNSLEEDVKDFKRQKTGDPATKSYRHEKCATVRYQGHGCINKAYIMTMLLLPLDENLCEVISCWARKK